SPAPEVVWVQRLGPCAALVSIPTPTGQIDLAVTEVVGVGLEREVGLIDCEADTELGPTEQPGAASWSQVSAVLPRNPGMRLHHEGDAARPDRIKRPQHRRRFVIGLD